MKLRWLGDEPDDPRPSTTVIVTSAGAYALGEGTAGIGYNMGGGPVTVKRRATAPDEYPTTWTTISEPWIATTYEQWLAWGDE